MIANINHILGLVNSDFVIVLPDDDLLYPDYLATTVTMLEQQHNAGAVHTACDFIDADGRIVRAGQSLMGSGAMFGVEPGRVLIERAMRTSGLAWWASCLFRTKAVIAAGGLRSRDLPYADYGSALDEDRTPLGRRMALQSAGRRSLSSWVLHRPNTAHSTPEDMSRTMTCQCNSCASAGDSWTRRRSRAQRFDAYERPQRGRTAVP